MSDPNAGSGSPILETLVAFAVVFALQHVAAVAGLVASLFLLSMPLSENPWTIVTSVYAHGNVGHLVSNSVALVLFGWPVARATTRLRFHTFFVATGATAGVAQVATAGALGIDTAVLGASGAVFALLGYLIAANRLSVGIASLVEVPRWLTALVFVALAVAVTYATAQPQAALVAHFVGFLLGLAGGRARLLDPGDRPRRERTTTM